MSARRLLQDIVRCNKRCIAETGDIDPVQVAALLESAFATTQDRPKLMLGLGAFIGAALSGVVIDPSNTNL